MSAAKHTPTLRVAPGDPSFVFVEGIVKPINCGSAKTAAFIVRACNSHDALVAALEQMCKALAPIPHSAIADTSTEAGRETVRKVVDNYERAVALLKAAKGGSVSPLVSGHCAALAKVSP